jgi:regulatory protein
MKGAGVITAMQLQKRYTDRVSVFLDEEYAFAVSLAMASTLRKGQRLTEAEVEALQQEGLENLAYQRALRYLGTRPRSGAEIVTYLKRKEYDEQVIGAVIVRLQENGYIDDDAFARFWIENRNRFRPKGAQALRYELRQKGIERETIEGALDEQDDERAAWAAVEGKIDRWSSLEKVEFDQKLISFLARRGFRFDVCRRTAAQAWEQVQESKSEANLDDTEAEDEWED